MRANCSSILHSEISMLNIKAKGSLARDWSASMPKCRCVPDPHFCPKEVQPMLAASSHTMVASYANEQNAQKLELGWWVCTVQNPVLYLLQQQVRISQTCIQCSLSPEYKKHAIWLTGYHHFSSFFSLVSSVKRFLMKNPTINNQHAHACPLTGCSASVRFSVGWLCCSADVLVYRSSLRAFAGLASDRFSWEQLLSVRVRWIDISSLTNEGDRGVLVSHCVYFAGLLVDLLDRLLIIATVGLSFCFVLLLLCDVFFIELPPLSLLLFFPAEAVMHLIIITLLTYHRWWPLQ